MNWFNRVRNSLSFLPKRSTEKDLWIKCPSCQEMVFQQEYADNAYVCPRCEHHGRIGADERLRQLLDEGFDVLEQPVVREDPLKFKDTKKYTERLKQARAKNPHRDAFTVGSRRDRGSPGCRRRAGFRFHGRQHGHGRGHCLLPGRRARAYP